MKKIKKPVFFIVFIVILAFTVSVFTGISYQFGDISTTYIQGIKDIRLGIDIQGGVDVTFIPADNVDATAEQLDAVKEMMNQRLSMLSINDSEVYTDESKDRIIVRFPWQSGETDFDPEAAVSELGETAMLTFRKGSDYETDEEGNVVPTGELVLEGSDIAESYVARVANDTSGSYDYVVALSLNDEGTEKFSNATAELYESGGSISIWMDNSLISAPTVSAHITDGKATISGDFTYESAKSLSDKINAGSLPFNLETESFKTISPTLGSGALNAMILSGIIAFAFIAVYMIVLYRLPGFVAAICLVGQVAGTLAAITKYFGFMDSSTITIPGIAGIILAVGMGVDANIITCERIKEELYNGRSLENALKSGYQRAFTSIFDGNITVIIVAVILMGAFGVPDSFCAKALNIVFRWFGTTTEATIYSFGYTLLVGVILNFIMGILASKLMIGSLAKFSIFKKKSLYGYKNKEVESK